MSRRTQSDAKLISLFSFLDSLICTMGALILLFMAMNSKIQQQAMDRALAERAAATRTPEPEEIEEPVVPPEPEPEAEPELPARPRYTEEDRQRDLAERAARKTQREAEWAKKVEEAKIRRDRELAAQRERQRSLTEVELEFRRIKERMFATSQASESTAQAREAALVTEKKLKGLEEQVTQQIETTRRNLDIAQRRQATASNEYALVPYDGTSGTMRRPIYIECTGNGYRFIPEDIHLGVEHLNGFSDAYNPLLTGTQALMRYWNARRKISANDPEPYVLLIVRPSGCLSYYIARKLLTPLGANFGYELVDEDWKLSTRDVDAQAKAALINAIEVTLEARAKVRESTGGKGSDESFVFNNRRFARGAGFPDELVTDPDGGGGDGGGTFAERAGNRARLGGSGPGTGGGSYPGSGRERARAALGGTGSDADGSGPGGLGNGSAGSGLARGGNGGAGGTGTGSGSTGAGGTGRQRAIAGNISGRPTGTAGQAGGEGNGFGGGTSPGFEGSGGSGIGEPGDGSGTGEGTGSGEGVGSGRPRRTGRPGGARPAAIGGGPADGMEGDGDGGDSNGGASSRAGGPSGGGTGSGRGAGTRRGSSGGSRGSSSGGTGGLGGDAGEIPTLEPLPEEMSPSHGHAPRVRSSDSGGSPGRLRNLEPEKNVPINDPPEDIAPRPLAFGQSSGDRPWLSEDAPAFGDRGGSSGGRGSRFAGPRGGGGGGGDPQRGGRRQWGNSRGRAGIGLEKQLEIHAYADRLAIGPNDATIGVGRGEKNDELTNHVLAGIERTAQTWGAPPANFYWIPAVKWVVHPGGNQYYERLRAPLEKWGINSTVEYNVSESGAGGQGGARR